ncbi:MAG: hypothetical protein IJ144_07360 [Prevotella sp.]|nr:hypothetical protein [Prevotella sp.]
MIQTDNTLHTEAIMLAMKALDVALKTLDMIVGTQASDEGADKDMPSESNTKNAETPGGHDSYRADAIRFNEQYLRDHYELRYNTMKKTTEFRPKVSDAQTVGAAPALPLRGVDGGELWRPVTDRDLNGMTVGQLMAGGQSWSYGMRLCVDSSRVESFNPVEDYLSRLPRWDGRDHIGELAARVPTRYEAWPHLFRRWLLAMVAQARGLSPDHGNSLVPLLIGAQGTGKTTFCKMLLPRELRQYYMDDIKMDSAEQVERVLGRMWLVNIDEYDAKTPREQAKIKRLLTERDVQVRRPHSDQYVMTRRLCSFIATTNDDRPLCDSTGSRRYLCVELSGQIDTATPLDHDQLFAQALQLLAQGEPFFLTRQEEAAMERHNRRYCRQLVLADAVNAVLQPAPVGPDTLMTATDIMNLLCDDGGMRPQDLPSPKQLAAALRSAGVRQGAQQGRHGWYAKALTGLCC